MDYPMAENASKHQRIILQKKCTIKDDCAICIDSLLAKPVMYLPCKHFFHQSCLNQAFEKKLYTCPLCRYDLVEALIKINFKFPMVYDMNTYANTIFYTYPYIYPYSYNSVVEQMQTDDAYADNAYDDMPELVDSDDESSLLWNRLFFNVMPASLDTAAESAPVDAVAESAHVDATHVPTRIIPITEPEYVVQDILIFYTV